jgi:hypothetical protein
MSAPARPGMPSLPEWSAQDLARNIVNQLFDEAGVPVETRQAINDRCDAWVAGLLARWRPAHRDGRDDAPDA